MAESAERYEVMCLLCLVLFLFQHCIAFHCIAFHCIGFHCIGMGKCILSIINGLGLGLGGFVVLQLSVLSFCLCQYPIIVFCFSFLFSFWCIIWLDNPVPYIVSYHIRL